MPVLRIRKTTPATEAKPQNLLERVKTKFAALHVKFPARPTKDGEPLNPILPPDLTVLNDVQLGKLYSEFCCMAQYIQLRLAILGVESAEAKRHEKITRALAKLRAQGPRDARPDFAEADAEVQEATMNVLVETQTEKLTQAVMEGYLTGKDAVSRELTRRISLQQLPQDSLQRGR